MAATSSAIELSPVVRSIVRSGAKSLSFLLMGACLACFWPSIAAGTDSVNFNRDILPVLSDRCFHCHGPDKGHREAKLRLDVPDGEEGALHALKPGDVEGSELWQRIISEDEDERMPPVDSGKKPLTAAERELFKQWIAQGAAYEKHWSFVAPRRTPPAAVKNEAWRDGMIDPYVMARLEQEGLTPKPEADKRTLIRRVTLDVTGLPPSVEQIDAFLKDDSPDAYEKLVDRLLADQAYGEHMARYWADVVRLADTNGMHKDFYRNFSPYRSWLIRAFNDDLSFDDFVRYQLAGDFYPQPSEDQLVASGFNRLHLIIDRGTALPEESHHKNVLDRVQAFGTAFLGMTVQCGQCHEHKFDPISQKEFYQLYAFFNNFDGDPETPGGPKGGIQAPSITLSGDQQGVVAMVMKERAEPKPTHILVRGSYEHPAEEVQRNTPAFLPPLKEKEGYYTRMDLADWLVDPQHPLTARVTVNRIWQQFFGVGLVKTSEDFGRQGQRPSHPELLDELAVSFIDSGWDVKRLVRAIVLSKTYRQSSDAAPEEFAHDPENRLLARGPRYRMDAEMIRDQILFVSGKLNRTMFGESVKPPQPPGLWAAVTMIGERYQQDKGDAIYRRSIYTFWKRGMPPPQMTILNAPSREFCAPRRERTNTPLQALLLMNEPEYFRLAAACAEQTRKATDGDGDRGLTLLYEKITSQLPDASRLELLQKTLGEFREFYASDEALAKAATPDLADATHDERAEAAAWTMMAHSLLNLELAKVKR
ncbi:MAG: PSD1 domain-containing protein [Planctomycetales bacterium]|nr:PSD1 domain-containing protein [Planctomycetales bacterium]